MRRLDAGHGNDITGRGGFDFDTLKPHETKHLVDLGASLVAFGAQDGHLLIA